MFLCPFSQCQRDKFRAVIYMKHGRIAMVFRHPVGYTDYSLSWQIQIDFNRQRLTVKVINDIERVKTTATDQLWFSASGVARDYAPATVVRPYGENSASADSQYGGSFCDPTGVLPPQNLEEFRKTVS